jgi:hypothetical protein
LNLRRLNCRLVRGTELYARVLELTRVRRFARGHFFDKQARFDKGHWADLGGDIKKIFGVYSHLKFCAYSARANSVGV